MLHGRNRRRSLLCVPLCPPRANETSQNSCYLRKSVQCKKYARKKARYKKWSFRPSRGKNVPLSKKVCETRVGTLFSGPNGAAGYRCGSWQVERRFRRAMLRSQLEHVSYDASGATARSKSKLPAPGRKIDLPQQPGQVSIPPGTLQSSSKTMVFSRKRDPPLFRQRASKGPLTVAVSHLRGLATRSANIWSFLKGTRDQGQMACHSVSVALPLTPSTSSFLWRWHHVA